MDWNLKGGSWDMTELDGGGLPNIETTTADNYDGSGRFGLVNGSGGEFCVDLKLGQVGNSGTESSGPKWKVAAAAGGGGEGGVPRTAASTPSGSSKRARAINNGIQTASCLVDGCSSDLSNCREYHRRHKVCELHSKAPVVTIGGHKQRFCQQCSRFHSLEEFDEGKRSCRKRLDGHNRRRRKPQPVPLTRSATLFSNYHQGRQLIPLSSGSNLYPSSAMVNTGWDWEWDARTTMVHHNNKHQIFLGSSESARIKQEVTTYHEKPCAETASGCHTVLRTTAVRPAGSFSSAEESPPPPCALSLLSSPPAPTYLSQSLGPTTLHEHGLQQAVDTTLLVSNGTQPSMYNLLGSDASQGIHTSQSLPFQWE
ncbi:squamosa promoter-binding-like protein 13A [Neltuma alba]|uniref:squamosa promoter-binding-like protein 13A n=1 Tax=Neltuma alba TaxID=207710 RepID=UPI0010A3F540|nr:squamosa promoter-binding-like protein 13A [Prosopis alba]